MYSYSFLLKKKKKKQRFCFSALYLCFVLKSASKICSLGSHGMIMKILVFGVKRFSNLTQLWSHSCIEDITENKNWWPLQGPNKFRECHFSRGERLRRWGCESVTGFVSQTRVSPSVCPPWRPASSSLSTVPWEKTFKRKLGFKQFPPLPSSVFSIKLTTDPAVKLVGSWAVCCHHRHLLFPFVESTTLFWTGLQAGTLGAGAGWWLCSRDCNAG